MSKLYVAYGSNMSKRQMGLRCPAAEAIGKGTLHGFTLEFRGRNGNGVATIIENRNTSVPVALWRITAGCEKALDAYEGFPHLYQKKTVEVEIDGRTVEAMVYIMAKSYERLVARPSAHYYGIIKEGYADFKIATPPLEEALSRSKKGKTITEDLRAEILIVREDGRTNMLDINGVIDTALEIGCLDLVDFLLDKANHGVYSNFIIYGD